METERLGLNNGVINGLAGHRCSQYLKERKRPPNNNNQQQNERIIFPLGISMKEFTKRIFEAFY